MSEVQALEKNNIEQPAVDGEIIQEESQEAEKSKHTLPTRKLRYARAFVMELFCVVVIMYVLLGIVFGVAAAPNDDMYPVAASGDLLVYYRLDKDVSSQDIITFKQNGTFFVGRVVGKGGDIIDITDSGNLVVNGHNVVEPNIHTPTYKFEGYVDYPITLGEDECFVLCEKRNGTEDSRYFGRVPKSNIKGTVITVIRRNSL